MTAALDGLRIIEFADELGSYCGRLLADLGAEVIKVEPPGGGAERRTPPFLAGVEPGPDTSLAFWVHNTSKKSVVLDLDSGEDQALARALVLSADAVLEDNPPGWMGLRGLDFGTLHRAKPSLVYTSITGFGQTGPHANYAYTDIVGQAMGGVMTLAGEMADPPNIIYGNQANVCASIQAAQGTLMAIIHAEATGHGQQVDVSVQESLSLCQETAMQTWDLQKKNRARTGQKGMIPVDLPAFGVYEAKDGHVILYVLAPGGEDLPALIAWLREKGMAEDLDEEPYASVCRDLNMAFLTRLMSDPANAMAAMATLNHIHQVIERFFRSLSANEAYVEGQKRRLLVGLASTPADLGQNEQLRARGWYRDIPFDYLGRSVEFPGAPYRLSKTPVAIGRPPRLGEHTAAILGSLDSWKGARP